MHLHVLRSFLQTDIHAKNSPTPAKKDNAPNYLFTVDFL
jgi:hypothetical protein